jgi:ceramide glucosyltransferase
VSEILIVAAAIFALLGVAGTTYFALSIRAALRYRTEVRTQTPSRYAPPVSILKSLKGVDQNMYAALFSHCVLDYPEYEILFGVRDPEEPALNVVRKLSEHFPLQSLRIVHCPEFLGLNGKVSNLAQMLPHARYDHIVINDSDIVVPRDYLRRVISPLVDPMVGMTTTLYRASAGQSVWSKVEALGLSSDFAGGVLLARAMEGGIRFGLGATIATTKEVLAEIGGLTLLADCLGDDYELGARTAATGSRVELTTPVVETALPDYDFREFWLHQMRWARNVKDRRPGQYFGLIATFGFAWAILAVVALPAAWWTWTIFAVTALVRVTAAFVVGKGVLDDAQVLRDLWLLPLRDFLALAIWIGSFFGNTVVWRGLRFRLKNGKLEVNQR